MLGQIFTHEMKPMEVEILVAEVGSRAGGDQLFHILYDGTVMDERRFSVLGGDAEAITARLGDGFAEGLDLAAAVKAARARSAGPIARSAPTISRWRCCRARTAGAASIGSPTPRSPRSSRELTQPRHGRRVDLNSDVGEGFGAWRSAADDALLGIVTAANVACGFHAGDPSIMRRDLRAGRDAGVAIGAQV